MCRQAAAMQCYNTPTCILCVNLKVVPGHISGSLEYVYTEYFNFRQINKSNHGNSSGGHYIVNVEITVEKAILVSLQSFVTQVHICQYMI